MPDGEINQLKRRAGIQDETDPRSAMLKGILRRMNALGLRTRQVSQTERGYRIEFGAGKNRTVLVHIEVQ